MRQTARRIGIAVLGSAILAIGVVMVVTPGPAVLVIPAGLGVLAWEFEWARALRERARAWLVERRGRQVRDRPERAQPRSATNASAARL